MPMHSRRYWRLCLPSEHGAWALFLLPLIAGLGLALGRASSALSVALVAGFLAREPLWRWRSGDPTSAHGGWVLILAGLALVGGVLALRSGGIRWLVPMGVSGLVGYPLWVGRRRVRGLESEIRGILALSGMLPALLLASHGVWREAGLAWGLLLVLVLPPFLLLRIRLEQLRGQIPSLAEWRFFWILQGLALALAGAAWWGAGAPWVLPVWVALLGARQWAPRGPKSARQAGWAESLVSVGHVGVLLACLR